MQVIEDSTGAYRSLVRSFQVVVKNEGWKGLYQGMSPALFAASGSWGGYFYIYELSKERKIKKLINGANLNTVDHVSTFDFSFIPLS